MAKTINTEPFIEASEREKCLWNVSSVIYKNRYKKAKSRKQLAEQFSVTRNQKLYCSTFLCLLWLYHLE